MIPVQPVRSRFEGAVCISMLLALLTVPSELAAGETAQGVRPNPLAYVAPSRNFDTVHTRLELDLDLERQAIAGSVTHTLRVLQPDTRTIRINCVDLSVDAVEIDGRPVTYEYPTPGRHSTSWIEIAPPRKASTELAVTPDRPLSIGDTIELTVRYHGAPKQGLYFIPREKGIPKKRVEVWSQGEGEDNRYWIPCMDYPNDKATFEGIFRVKKGLYALSNGRLVAKRDVGNQTEYHWRLDTPQVSYLIMVAAARYDIFEDKWRDVDLMYLVPPGTSGETVRRAMGLTPDMMDFFSRITGIDYPFEKYAQVVVQNFIYGGMENTTATVMNERLLYDERRALTQDQDGLVSHELAHQWWGDMVTCRDWSHLWLNEGFATYFGALYTQHNRGDDEFRLRVDEIHRQVVARDDEEPRPLVVQFFNRKDERNSNNVYIKGASVLHMLRFLLGDELFFKSLKTFGERHKYGLAETNDFVNAIKEVTGENIDWFFEQWVYLAGHPKLSVSKTWDEATKTLKLSVTQTQKVADLTPSFRLPLDVEITCNEKKETYRIIVERSSQDYYFSVPSKPQMVIFDKGAWTLKSLDFRKSPEELLFQLRNGETIEKIHAIRSLADEGVRGAVEALRATLLADGFWGLRREAALALGKIGSDDALEALLEAVGDREARVRLAVAEALGEFKGLKRVEEPLFSLLERDPAYDVAAAAVGSLVKMKSESATKACLTALKRESDQDVVRNAGLSGLATLKATKEVNRVKALTPAGNPRTYRHEAIASYAALAKELPAKTDREAAAQHLAGMLDDWYVRTRQAVISALDNLGEKNVVPDLGRVARNDAVSFIRDAAERAAAAIEARSSTAAQKEKLEGEIKMLSDKVEELERSLKDLKARFPEKPAQ